MTILGIDPVTFVIGGEPTAKGRARMGRSRNGAPVSYTPAKTRAYEAHGRLAAQEAMQSRAPITGAIAAVPA